MVTAGFTYRLVQAATKGFQDRRGPQRPPSLGPLDKTKKKKEKKNKLKIQEQWRFVYFQI